jgi:hypothetical protein
MRQHSRDVAVLKVQYRRRHAKGAGVACCGGAGSEEMVAVEGLVEGELLIKGAIGLLRQGSTVLFTPNTPAPAAATLPPASSAAR